MNQELIIIVKQESLTCVAIRQAQVSDLVSFDFDQKLLVKWLKNYSGQGVHVVLDLLEEEVYIDDSPMLFPWEQGDYANRQMRKRFPKTQFCQFKYETQPALPWQSRSGFLLMTGMNDDVKVNTLLEWCDQLEVMVFSIYSAGLLLPELFHFLWFEKSKEARKSWVSSPMILLAKVENNSYRQLLIVNGFIRTSRQFLLKDQSVDMEMQQLVQEIKLFDKFVRTQKMLPYDQPLKLYYLGLTIEDKLSVSQVFEGSIYQKQGLNSLSLEEVTQSLSPQKAWLPMMLPILSFHHKSHNGDYFPSQVMMVNKYRQYRQIWWGVLLFSALFAIGYVVYFSVMSVTVEQQISSYEQENTNLAKESARLSELLKLDVSIEHLQSSVDLAEHILKKKDEQALTPYLVSLAQSLEKHPNIHFSSIHWSPTLVSNFEAIKYDANLFGVDLSAMIVVDNKTPLKAVLTMMEDYLLTLKNLSAIESVEFIQKPVDLDSSKQLQIKAEDITDKPEQTFPFKLRINFKAGHV